MNENYIQNLFADRIGGKSFTNDLVIFKFEKIKRAKAYALKSHPERELLDFGIGESDEKADNQIVNELYQAALDQQNRGYADNGILEFKQAAAEYMRKVYNIEKLDPIKEINHGIGSKSILAMLPMAFINPGDYLLITIPGYPISSTITEWLGGKVFHLPLLKERHFLPDFTIIPPEILQKAKLLYINYPNNPTGACATIQFYEEVVRFAKKHQIIVISDEAYASLVFNDNPPLSFLNVQGSKEVGVSVQSLSKSFNMTGWRLAFIAGNSLIVKAFATIKDNQDSGQFRAIQKAGIYALNHPEITQRINQKLSRRHELLVITLKKFGFKCEKPKGTFYIYVEAPNGIKNGRKFNSASNFSEFLITEKSISTVPWDDVGKYVRFSVTYNANSIEEEKRIMEILANRLKDEEFYY